MLSNPDTLVVHYSATYPDAGITAKDIDRMHKERGFREIGYHWFIRRDGTLEEGRRENEMSASVRGHNGHIISICFAGGVERATGPNKGVWNPTSKQERVMLELIRDIRARHPSIKLVTGHKNMTGAATDCPGRDDVTAWYKHGSQGITKSTDGVKQHWLTSLITALLSIFKR